VNIKLTHSASARVRLEVEIQVGSKWGADCSIQQVHEQAFEEASGKLGRMIEKSGEHGVRIVGDPVITAVIVEGKQP
jgi:hypothetical protein